MTYRFRRGSTAFAAAVATALLVAGMAQASIPESGGVYTACKLKATGTIRLIDPSLGTGTLLGHCTKHETQITWNQKGVPGTPGTNGMNGKDGKAGAPGTNGTNGANGTNGMNGKDGKAGATGAPGTNGTNGMNGKDGKDGLPGAPGGPGTNGMNGKDGKAGAPGTNGTDGAQGLKGDPCLAIDPACIGPRGAAGAPGKDGTNGTNGTNGIGGAQGPKGDPGTGFTWRGAFAERTLYNAGDVVSFQGTAWITNESIGSGDIFPPDSPWQLLAAKGDAGANGLNGTNGVNGTNGTNGGPGPQGPIGPQGPTGPAGANTRWARIAADGTFIAHGSGVLAVYLFPDGPFKGSYQIDFDRDITPCALIATSLHAASIRMYPEGALFEAVVQLWASTDIVGNPNFIQGPFSVVVFC